MKRYRVAIVGATGLVGRKLLEVLEERKFPIRELTLLASKRSVGKHLTYRDKEIGIKELDQETFDNIDLAFFCINSKLSQIYIPRALAKDVIVIDNSSYYRMEPDVPLVAANVNNEDIKEKSFIANPNCSTLQCMIPLKILKDMYGISEVRYVTYQSVSGSGMRGIRDLILDEQDFYPQRIKYSCIPKIGDLDRNGYTEEEWKMVNETRRILHEDTLPIEATCVRVPVLYCHAILVEVKLKQDFDLDDIRKSFKESVDIIVSDDLEHNVMPNTLSAINNDIIFIGRIRKSLIDNKTLLFYCVSDNLRRGAASNAVLIAEYMIKRKITH